MFSTNVTPAEEDQGGAWNVAVAGEPGCARTTRCGVKELSCVGEADSVGRNRFCFTAVAA
jgi:hypothetical protein